MLPDNYWVPTYWPQGFPYWPVVPATPSPPAPTPVTPEISPWGLWQPAGAAMVTGRDYRSPIDDFGGGGTTDDVFGPLRPGGRSG